MLWNIFGEVIGEFSVFEIFKNSYIILACAIFPLFDTYFKKYVAASFLQYFKAVYDREYMQYVILWVDGNVTSKWKLRARRRKEEANKLLVGIAVNFCDWAVDMTLCACVASIKEKPLKML